MTEPSNDAPRTIRPWDDTPGHRAVIRPPGSKSETNRQIILAALAKGATTLHHPLVSDDCDRLLNAVETLGVTVTRSADSVTIEGVNGQFPNGGTVDLGDGGTPSRFMIAAACLASDTVTVDGSPRMRERPVDELVGFLRALGGDLQCVNDDDHLPIRVTPTETVRNGGELVIPTTQSSQFISALMLIAPWLRNGLELKFDGPVTSRSYIDLTAHVLDQWGGHAVLTDDLLDVSYGPLRARQRVDIEPDASSATYWWSAAAILKGLDVVTPDLDARSIQADAQYLKVMTKLGCDVLHAGDGGVVVRSPRMPKDMIPKTLQIFDMELMPDAALGLAAILATRPHPSRITGLRTLRVKETDRISALANELQRIGCTVETTDDSIDIDPSTMHNTPVVIETYNDHRMAMAFAILGLARPGISIENPQCVGKSYPGFWDDLERLRGGAHGA